MFGSWCHSWCAAMSADDLDAIIFAVFVASVCAIALFVIVESVEGRGNG